MIIEEAKTVSFPEMKALMNQLNPELKVTEEMVQAVVDAPDSHLYLMKDGDRHLGKEMVQHLLNEARAFAPIAVHLTSRPVREVANKLYQSLGFTQKLTNFYILNINP